MVHGQIEIYLRKKGKNERIANCSEFSCKKMKLYRGCSRGVMVKALECGIVVSEFELQSCYYVNFQTNTLGKGMSPLILPAMG